MHLVEWMPSLNPNHLSIFLLFYEIHCKNFFYKVVGWVNEFIFLQKIFLSFFIYVV